MSVEFGSGSSHVHTLMCMKTIFALATSPLRVISSVQTWLTCRDPEDPVSRSLGLCDPLRVLLAFLPPMLKVHTANIWPIGQDFVGNLVVNFCRQISRSQILI
jgi:hypothetical protein